MKFLLIRTLTLIIIYISIFSCSTTVRQLNQQQVMSLTQRQGVVVLGLESNIQFEKLNIVGTVSTEIDKLIMDQAKPFVIISLPVGNYKLDKVWIDNSRYVDLQEWDSNLNWDFRVEENSITYVGHFQIKKIGDGPIVGQSIYLVQNINKSSQALEFLENEYKDTLKSFKLIFNGTQRDDFFNYVSKLKGYKYD